MSSTSNSVEKLKGRENFDSWLISARSYLTIKGLWSCVNTDRAANANASEIEKYERALSELTLLLEPACYSYIVGKDTPKGAWESINKAFSDSGVCRRVTLLQQLVSVKLADCNGMEDYVNRMVLLSTKVSSVGFKIDDDVIASLMLAGLPSEYRPLILGVENSQKVLTVDYVKNLLLQEVIFGGKANDTDSALLAKSKKKFSSKVKCYECGGPHYARNCKKNKKKSENALFNENALFSAFVADDNRMDWYIDSGASAHMTRSDQHLMNQRESPKKEVLVANNHRINVFCVGDLKQPIHTDGEKKIIDIKDVQYVPDMCVNLLSVSQMAKKGNEIVFNKHGCTIYNGNREVIATGSLVNNMYKLNTYEDIEIACAAKNETVLWHRRLGHIGVSNMSFLKNVQGVKLNSIENFNCEACLEGKQSRSPFKSEGKRATKLLEIIHSDVCGPMSVTSMSGKRYFVTFIDDFSRKVFVYMTRQKSDVFDCFVNFKTLVENQTERKIKIIRSDGGLEYCNNKFGNLCTSSGILHQITAPYSPQQNGLAERMNRTIVEKVRCMLADAKLSKSFWAEAVSTAVKIINLVPNTVNKISPDEIWFGCKPDFLSLKVFGCIAMVHIPNEKRKKLDKKSQKCVFVGYADNAKAYRLFNTVTKKIVISRDVAFFETDEQVNESIEPFSSRLLVDDEIVGRIESGREVDRDSIVEDGLVEDGDMRNIDNPNGSGSSSNFESADTSINSSTESINVSSDDAADPEYEPDETVVIPTTTISRATRRNVRSNALNPLNLNFAFYSVPETVNEALKDDHSSEWEVAMREEIASHDENGTWELSVLPPGKKPIKSKWVFATKTDSDGNVIRYKARLVAKGYSQKAGIDYEETFAPVVKYTSIRFCLSLAAQLDLNISQMDAVTAYLNGTLKEEVYMEQPEMFNDGSGKVCKLIKSIYGLKQSGRNWNELLNVTLLAFGLKRSKADQCIYYMKKNNSVVIVLIYVDDFLIMFNDPVLERELRNVLCNKFKMKYLGEVNTILGMRVTRERKNRIIHIDQSKYINGMLVYFGMGDCHPISTPLDSNQKISAEMCPIDEDEKLEMGKIPYREAIGSLLYLAQITRPDINYAVNLLSRYSTNPGKGHWQAVKRIFRYLKGTSLLGITYGKVIHDVVGFCDADWAGDLDKRKSTTGYIFIMNGGAISWSTKKQPTVALSTTEAEYMSVVAATQEAIWLKCLREFFLNKSDAVLLHCDNQGAIHLSKNNAFSSRTKHIHIKLEFVKEKIETGVIELMYVPTNEMLADLLTKGLTKEKLNFLMKQFGMF